MYSYCSSMYSYRCLFILIVVYVFVQRLPWLRFFRAFSSVVRQMPGYNSPRRGTARTIQNCCFVLCIVCSVSFCVLFVCKCVLYYCHRVTTQFQLKYISISNRYRSSLPVIRRPECKGDYFPLSSTKNEWSNAISPPYVFRSCKRPNFYMYFF